MGKGTTFTPYFPVSRKELTAPQKKAPIERYMGKGESVLVVDDIAEQRDIAVRLLTRRSTAVGTYWPLEWRKSLKSRGRVSGKLEKL